MAPPLKPSVFGATIEGARRTERTIHHGEDIIFKCVSQIMGDDLIRAYGLEPCRIIRAVPTETVFLPRKRRLDSVFQLADGSCLHLEFQSKRAPLRRFLVYDALLYQRDRRPIRTVVIYTGGITKAPSRLDAGCVTYAVENVFMSRLDGAASRQAAADGIRKRGKLSKKELMDLIFSPLMSQGLTPGEAVLAALEVAGGIEEEEERGFCMAAIIVLGDKFLDAEQREKAKEAWEMTRVAELIREEGLVEGMEKGMEKGLKEGRAQAVLLVLQGRFGDVPASTKELVESQEAEETLNEMVLAAATSGSLEEFQVRLGQLVKN